MFFRCLTTLLVTNVYENRATEFFLRFEWPQLENLDAEALTVLSGRRTEALKDKAFSFQTHCNNSTI